MDQNRSIKTMYQRKMVSIETEQAVLKSDPQWTSSSDIRPAVPKFRRSWKSILNLGCDIGSNFVKSHHSAVKVAYLKVTKISAKFWNIGDYGNCGNYGNSAILLLHNFPNGEIIAPNQRTPSCHEKKPFRCAIGQALPDRCKNSPNCSRTKSSMQIQRPLLLGQKKGLKPDLCQLKHSDKWR